MHVRLNAYKSAPSREHEHQSIFDLRVLRSFQTLSLSTVSKHEVLRHCCPARPGGHRGSRETHRGGGVHRTGTGRTRLAGSGQKQARVAAERGLHGADCL